MSNKTLDVTLKVLDYFKENPDAKVRHLSLSNELGEDPNLIKKILSTYSMFFLYLPQQAAYILNKAGKYKGDVVTMKINAEDLVKEKNLFQRFWKVLILLVLVIAYFVFL